MKNNKTRSEIRIKLLWQLTGVITVIIILTLGMVWLENSFFLEDFYLSYKQEKLEELYNSYSQSDRTGQLYERDYFSEFEESSAKNNVSVVIIKPDASVALSTQQVNSRLADHLFRVLFSGAGLEEIAQRDSYRIFLWQDDTIENEYLVFLGNFDSGNMIFMETTMESIRDFVGLVRRLILVTGAISILIGLVLAYLITRQILKPLNELTAISERMSKLDFDVKYKKKSITNEIDILGLRMNDMSSMIEQNIKDLKQANINLERDIRIKEENESMRREFISNVSHELKTPISLIIGYCEGLTEDIADSKEKRDKYINVISDEAKKIDSILTKLFELNEMEYGKLQIQMARLDLAKIIQEEIYGVLFLAKKADVTIENKVTGPFSVWSDEFLTRQVVNNYLTNAIRYAQAPTKGQAENETGDKTSTKNVVVSIDKEGDRIILKIFNTGDEIDSTHKEKIWDKFYKIDPARSRQKGGSGIGLSIVKSAADILGADYGFHNGNGGVEFYFSFDNSNFALENNVEY